MDKVEELASRIGITLENIGYIKGIQIIYTPNISPQAIMEISQKFENPELMLFIIGIQWPKFQNDEIMEIPKNNTLNYPENIRIIKPSLFEDLIGMSGQYKGEFYRIVEYIDSDALNHLDSLQDFHDSNNVESHNTSELKDDLRQAGWFFLA